MSKYWNDKKRQEKKSKEAQRKLTGLSPVKKTPREYFTSVGVAPSKLDSFFAKDPTPLHCEDCGRDFAADEKMEFALECVYQTECLMHELKQAQTVKKLLG